MICSKCGTDNKSGNKFCITCGSLLEPAQAPEAPVAPPQAEVPAAAPQAEVPATAPQAEAAAPQEKKNPLAGVIAGASAAVKAVGDTVKPLCKTVGEKMKPVTDKLKPVTDKVKPILAMKPVKIGLAAAAGLLVVVLIICIIAGAGNGFINRDHYVSYKYVEDELVFIVDDKVLSTRVETEGLSDFSANIDGTIGSALTAENELYVISGKKVKKIAEDVDSFILSVDGTGIAYSVAAEDEGTELYLYNVKKSKRTTIAKEISGSYAISPDGDSLCYFTGFDEEGERDLMFSDGKDKEKVSSNVQRLFGLSNKGKYIYASTSNDEGEVTLYSYNKSGDKTKLGRVNDSVYFNADHTQVLFFNDDKSYISNKGAEAEKAASDRLYLALPSTASRSSADTYPVKDLFGHVYYTLNSGAEYTSNIWLIEKNTDKSVKLLSKISWDFALDDSAEYMYYVEDDELRYIKISHGERASDKSVKLAEDVDSFMLTPNRKYVYFESDDSLYSINGKNGKGKTTVCNDDVDDYRVSRKGVCYYASEGDAFATKNGKKGKRILSDVESISLYSNGTIFLATEDTLYLANGTSKPKKLLDLE